MKKNKKIKLKKKIAIIVGARPNFVKVCPIIDLLNKEKAFNYIFIHTGQHYDFDMSNIFFEELNISKPDINLGIRSDKCPFTVQIALIKKNLQRVFKEERPDICLVFGDCNSAIGGALAANSMKIPICHVEAGLRSFDRTMSEESNRLITDLLSEYFFTSCVDAGKNLINEGHDPKKIFFVGNIMIDTLIKNKNKILIKDIKKKLKIDKKPYGVLTLHRYNNIDTKPVIKEILEALLEIQKNFILITPLHPSASKKIEGFFPGFLKNINKNKNLKIIKPLGYLEMISLLKDAKLVLTDSGGVQEETTFLKVPCLTLRNNTERPVTLTVGSNAIAGTSKESIIKSFNNLKNNNYKIQSKIPAKWDGKTAQRIIKILEKKFST